MSRPTRGPRGRAVLEYFAGRDLSPELRDYLTYNARRYAVLLKVVGNAAAELRAEGASNLNVLDVGINFQTELLPWHIPDLSVDGLGYRHADFEHGARRHFDFDLNHLDGLNGGPVLEGYHIVVLAEVIEHLFVGPTTLMRFLADALVPGGYLVVQTPNSVALHKRLRMLAGRPPVGPMPEDRRGDTHLHEYTIDELTDAGRRAGLTPVITHTANYFGDGPAGRAYGVLGAALPPRLRHGLTVAFRAPGAAPG